MKYRQTLAAVGAGLVLATGVLLGATPASAQTPDAMVRAAHFSPTTPGVDVYLSPFSGVGKLWLSAHEFSYLPRVTVTVTDFHSQRVIIQSSGINDRLPLA